MTTEPEATRISGISIDGGTSYVAFDLDTVLDDEAIALEDAFGMPWLAFLNGLTAGSIKAQKALVWLAQRRENPDLAPGDVSYELRKFEMRMEPAEAPLAQDEPSSEPVTWAPSPTSSASANGSGSTSPSTESTDTSTISTP